MNMEVDSAAYHVMIAACVISDELDGLDYEDIWEFAKSIQSAWEAGFGSQHKYIQEYARSVCRAYKGIYS